VAGTAGGWGQVISGEGEQELAPGQMQGRVKGGGRFGGAQRLLLPTKTQATEHFLPPAPPVARGLGAELWVGEPIPARTGMVGARLGWEAGPSRRDAQLFSFAPSDYTRPTPPPRSGYHRYQLRLYEQPPHKAITLSPEERVSLGKEQPCPRSQPHAVLRGAFPGVRITPCIRASQKCQAGDAPWVRRDFNSLPGTWLGC